MSRRRGSRQARHGTGAGPRQRRSRQGSIRVGDTRRGTPRSGASPAGLRGSRPSGDGGDAAPEAAPATLRARGWRPGFQWDPVPARGPVRARGEGRAPAGAGLLAGSVPGAARQVAVALRVRPGLPQPAPDLRMHPGTNLILRLGALRAPDRRRDLPVRPALRAPLQRGQQFAIPVPRTHPGRGAGTPDQRSSIRRTVRTSSRPPSSGKAAPPEKRTWTAPPGRSTFSTSAPSASRRPRSEAPPAAASAVSGAPSRAALASAIGPRAQKGETSPLASKGSSQASRPQSRAPRSAAVCSLTGKGAASGRPGGGRRCSHALR